MAKADQLAKIDGVSIAELFRAYRCWSVCLHDPEVAGSPALTLMTFAAGSRVPYTKTCPNTK